MSVSSTVSPKTEVTQFDISYTLRMAGSQEPVVFERRAVETTLSNSRLQLAIEHAFDAACPRSMRTDQRGAQRASCLVQLQADIFPAMCDESPIITTMMLRHVEGERDPQRFREEFAKQILLLLSKKE